MRLFSDNSLHLDKWQLQQNNSINVWSPDKRGGDESETSSRKRVKVRPVCWDLVSEVGILQTLASFLLVLTGGPIFASSPINWTSTEAPFREPVPLYCKPLPGVQEINPLDAQISNLLFYLRMIFLTWGPVIKPTFSDCDNCVTRMVYFHFGKKRNNSIDCPLSHNCQW